MSIVQLLYECKHIYIDAFGLTKKVVWQMYDD